MTGETITITLGRGANTSTLETAGFKGEACKTATEKFKQHLGSVSAEANTPEYFEATACEQAQQQT
jgi:Protein of unknown function (DUF2997)